MSDDRVAREPAPPRPENALAGIAAGESLWIDWLRRRVRERAARRFSTWAWSWIEDDFNSELILQIAVTATKSSFSVACPAPTYIDTCIANLCTKYFIRIARIRRNVPLDEHTRGIADRAPEALDRTAAALELRRALHALSPGCRRILLDKYALGMSLKEIAEKTGVEPKTVQSRLHTCRERLRDVFGSGRERN